MVKLSEDLEKDHVWDLLNLNNLNLDGQHLLENKKVESLTHRDFKAHAKEWMLKRNADSEKEKAQGK